MEFKKENKMGCNKERFIVLGSRERERKREKKKRDRERKRLSEKKR